jgi:hypothetical protein
MACVCDEVNCHKNYASLWLLAHNERSENARLCVLRRSESTKKSSKVDAYVIGTKQDLQSKHCKK